MKKETVKNPKFVQDKTSSGHDRVGCSFCCRAVVKQPYMTNETWESVMSSFKANHECYGLESDTVPNENLAHDLVIDLSNGPLNEFQLSQKLIKEVVSNEKVILTPLGHKYISTYKALKEILGEVLERKPRVKLVCPKPFGI
ncbi:MAG: hypothetical protein WC375_00245 [Methanomassiliicoccales archaeon]|jgi:hypothetical protein